MSDETPTIPKPRFDAVLARAKEAEAALATLQAEHKALTKSSKAWQRDAEIAAELRTERDTLQAQVGKQAATNQAHMDMLTAGVTDPEVRDYAWHRFGQQGEDGKPWDKWWSNQQAEPSAVLRPFLAPEQQSQPAAVAEAPQVAHAPEASPAAPTSNNGARPTPPAPESYTPGSIASLPREARKAALAEAMTGGGLSWPFN